MRLTAEGGGRVERFFGGLYAHCEGGSLEVRSIDLAGRLGKQGASCKSEWFPLRSWKEAQAYSKPLNAMGYDTFFMVNPVCRGGQEDKDVMAGVALFADIDNLRSQEEAEAKLEEVLTFPIQPDAAVFSGNGLHIYSFLKESYDPARMDWGIYLKALRAYAKRFGGDPACTNPSRVLRFPLNYSWKRKCPTLLWLREEVTPIAGTS